MEALSVERILGFDRRRIARLVAVFGPGLVVMLADTDAGSLITAAQSGARWGYRLLLLQVLLVPILFVVQELTVRLGLITGRGHGELIRERFGKAWAWLSVSTLALACVGALVTEFSGLGSVGQLFGIPLAYTVIASALFMAVVVWTGSYRSVERIALFFGAFELIFIYVALRSHPSVPAMMRGMASMPLHDPQYLSLVAANIGAVIMPWMVFYQQSAVIDKGLTHKDLRLARWDTWWGSLITQLVMIGLLVATAATIGRVKPDAALDTVQQIAQALTPFFGESTGRVLFALGFGGASLVAAIVVGLAAAWGLGEVMGYKRSLEHKPAEAPWFYTCFTGALASSAAIVLSGTSLVKLSIGVEIMNAALLPIVLGFLYALGLKALPKTHRLRGGYAIVVGAVVLATSGFGLYSVIASLLPS